LFFLALAGLLLAKTLATTGAGAVTGAAGVSTGAATPLAKAN